MSERKSPQTKGRLSRREFLGHLSRTGAGIAGAALLAACGASPAATPADEAATAGGVDPEVAATSGAAAPPAGEAKISMLGWGSPLEKENVDAGLKIFQERNPGITVEWLHTPQDYATKLKTMLAGGTPPDVFWTGNLLDYVARNTVLDITSYMQADPVLSEPDYFLQPQETERCTYNGKWYGIGSCWVIPHLYYNVDMLEKAGVEPPSNNADEAWSWDQFVEAGRKLTIDAAGKHPGEEGFDSNNVQQWGISWPNWSLPRDVLVYANGGEGFTKENTVKLGEPAAVEAIQSLADLAVKHNVAPLTAQTEQMGMSSQQMLASGKLAILADGSWALQDIAKLGFKYGTGVLPKMEKAVSMAQAHLHVISKETDNQDASWALLAFLSSDDYQRGLCKVGLWLPSHTSLLTEEGLGTWITEDVHPTGYTEIATEYLTKHSLNYFYPPGFEEANQVIVTALDPVWIGQATAADALTPEVIEKAQAVIQKTAEDLPA